jgi:hypothetical protein
LDGEKALGVIQRLSWGDLFVNLDLHNEVLFLLLFFGFGLFFEVVPQEESDFSTGFDVEVFGCDFVKRRNFFDLEGGGAHADGGPVIDFGDFLVGGFDLHGDAFVAAKVKEFPFDSFGIFIGNVSFAAKLLGNFVLGFEGISVVVGEFRIGEGLLFEGDLAVAVFWDAENFDDRVFVTTAIEDCGADGSVGTVIEVKEFAFLADGFVVLSIDLL